MSTASFSSTVPQKFSARKQLCFLRKHFTKGSFDNLVGITRSSLKEQKQGNLSVMAKEAEKCVSTISYFFNNAVWKVRDVRKSIRLHLLRSPVTKIEEGDIAAFDESSISKNGTKFQFIGTTWDNAQKERHTGYSLLCCAIVSTKKNVRWVFDEIFFSNTDPCFFGAYLYAERMLKRLFAETRVSLVVFDAGFRNQYLVKYVTEQGKNLILRITGDMVIWDEKKEKKCAMSDIGNMAEAKTEMLTINGKRGWGISWYRGIVNAWMKEVNVPLTVVLIHRPSFRKPMALTTSLPVETADDARKIYETYLNRWKIETLFQDVKELGLESFRVRRKVAIIKYITLVILVHSLVTLSLGWVRSVAVLCTMLESILRVKRKIKILRFRGMKIFYELLLHRDGVFREVRRLLANQAISCEAA